VALCTVCTVHVETRSTSFMVEPKNQRRRFVSGLASKPLGRFSPIWPQKQRRRFSPVWPQNQWLGFPSLGLKIGISGLVIRPSKLTRWFLGLGLKTKQSFICRLHHKTDRGRMVWDTRRDLVACFAWWQVELGFPIA
jgi:hypothetical protein